MSIRPTNYLDRGLSINSIPSDEHEERERLLKNLAFLLGCNADIRNFLPDGKCPDVMQLNLGGRVLFIGDAKVSESPTNRATQKRLSSYMGWAAVHASRVGSTSLVAICFMDCSHTQGWVDTLYKLGNAAGCIPINGRIIEFANGFNVVYFIFLNSHTEVPTKEVTNEEYSYD
jgi:hypothetical protein